MLVVRLAARVRCVPTPRALPCAAAVVPSLRTAPFQWPSSRAASTDTSTTTQPGADGAVSPAVDFDAFRRGSGGGAAASAGGATPTGSPSSTAASGGGTAGDASPPQSPSAASTPAPTSSRRGPRRHGRGASPPAAAAPPSGDVLSAAGQAGGTAQQEGAAAATVVQRPINWNAPYRYQDAHISGLVDAYLNRDLDTVMALFTARREAAAAGRAAAALRDHDDAATWPPSTDGLEPDFLEYNIVLDACAKAGRLDCVSMVVEDMAIRGVMLDADHYTLVLKAAAVANDYSLATRTFDAMKAAGCTPPQAAYAAMIHLAMANDTVDVGYRLFNRMKREGVAPNDTMYWAIFSRLFADGAHEHASFVWRNLDAHSLYVPSQPLCSLIVTGFAEADNVTDMQAVLRRMRRTRWGRMTASPDALRAAFYCYVRVGQAADAFKLLAAMRRSDVLEQAPGLEAELTDVAAKLPGFQAAAADAAGGGGGSAASPASAPATDDDGFFDRPAGWQA